MMTMPHQPHQPRQPQEVPRQEVDEKYVGSDHQLVHGTPTTIERSPYDDRSLRDISTLQALDNSAGIDGDCSSSGNTAEPVEQDVEIERLWKRLNSLNEELPSAPTFSAPSTMSSSGSDGDLRRRRSRNGMSDYGDEAHEEHETRLHQREIAGKLEEIQRAIASNGADKNQREELDALYARIKELEAYVEVAESRRLQAESRAENLEAGLHVMADRWDLEIAAREAAESNANRCLDLIAEARIAWQKTQVTVERRERELAAKERKGVREAGNSLEHRLEAARKEKELERKHSAALRLALEGSFAAKRASSPAATMPSVQTARSGNVGSSGRRAEDSRSLSRSQALNTKDVRVAAAEARLEAAIEMATTAATSKRTKEVEPPRRRRSRVEDVEKHRHHQHGSDTAAISRPSPPSRFRVKDRPELGGGDIHCDLHNAKTSTTSCSGAVEGSCSTLKHVHDPTEGGGTARSIVGDELTGAEKGKGDEVDIPRERTEEDSGGMGTLARLKKNVGSALKVMNEARNLQVHDSKEGIGAIAALCSVSSGFAF